MDVTTYEFAARLAGDWARGLYPRPIPITALPRLRVRVGIYCACRIDCRLLYVGSATRPHIENGVASRIREHSLHKRQAWKLIWIIPLHDETPPDVVHIIEGQVIDF